MTRVLPYLDHCLLHRLLLLGADPNKRSWKQASSRTPSMSPLMSVCVAYASFATSSSQNVATKTSIIADLITSGADPSVDRFWLEGGSTGASRNSFPFHCDCVSRRLEEKTRRALAELSVEPRSLQTLAACVVRKCLAAAEFNGVVKNTDSLPLPSTIKAMLKLEITNI